MWDAAQGSIDANSSKAAKEGSAEKLSGAAKGGKVASFESRLEATVAESPEKFEKPSEVGEKSRNDWRDEEIAPLLEELEALCQAGQVEEAAFAAAAFLTTVGINPPQLLQWGKRIHSYKEMMRAKEKAQNILEEAESKLGVTDPAQIWEALDQMDCMLSFLEPVCIIERGI